MITEGIDLAQVVLYAFWIFFAGLIVYLRREDKREGYPLHRDGGLETAHGWPVPPDPKPARASHPALAVSGPVVTVAPAAPAPPPPTPSEEDPS